MDRKTMREKINEVDDESNGGGRRFNLKQDRKEK